MAIKDAAAALSRVVQRETLGAMVRAKAMRADNLEKVAELVTLRADNPATLTIEDFVARGREWNQHPAALHALADAESSGRGFDTRNRALASIEPHAFSCATLNAFDRTHPHLSYPEFVGYRKGAAPPRAWGQHPYTLSQDGRWAIFEQWAELNPEAACSAMGLGRFQQLVGRTPAMKRHGLEPNWKALGFASAETLFRKLFVSEQDQFEVLYLFLRANGLTRALAERDWRTLARAYNGPAQVEAYAAKLAVGWKVRARTYNV